MNLDLTLFHAVNAWCGTPTLDLLAIASDQFVLLKGGISIAAFWCFWFYGDTDRNRRIIIATLFGVMGAIVLSRAMTLVLPFRIRPMYAVADFHATSIAFPMNLENWSSFPSDNAAMWFALSFGLWKMSRPAGIVAVLYSTLWVCLPRLYLGAHYPSDLAVGALLGWTTSWLAQHMPLDPISNVALRLERTRPYVFYPAMFLASYEMAAIFEDVRLFMRAIHQMHGGHIVIYVLAGGFVLCIGAAAFAKYMKLRTAKVAAASYIASTSDKMSLNGHHS